MRACSIIFFLNISQIVFIEAGSVDALKRFKRLKRLKKNNDNKLT